MITSRLTTSLGLHTPRILLSSPFSSMARPTVLPATGRHTPTRTVLVLGASYAGHRAVQQLVSLLPRTWRVVVLERNTHFNHLYAFPRMSVVPGHEHKIFVPYTKLFEPLDAPATSTANVLLHGSLSSLAASASQDGGPALGRGVATYVPLDGAGSKETTARDIAFDYLVYALGSHLPPPINLWSTVARQDATASEPAVAPAETVGEPHKVHREEVTATQTRGTKTLGVQWLCETQAMLRDAESVLVIGGGALGVRECGWGGGWQGRMLTAETEYASDVAWTYGTAVSPARWEGHSQRPTPKQVTLLSSSDRILPRFQSWMHEEAVHSLQDLGVQVITGARADMSTLGDTQDRQRRTIKTLDGRSIEADVVLFCTGQRPNTGYLSSFGNVVDAKTGMASVLPSLQLTGKDGTGDQAALNHVFVVGDAADAFGALNAGHTAFDQAEVAARNVARLVAAEEGKVHAEQVVHTSWLEAPLEAYHATPHRIKVSVGLHRAISEVNGAHRIITDGKEDLNAAGLWTRRGLDIRDMTV